MKTSSFFCKLSTVLYGMVLYGMLNNPIYSQNLCGAIPTGSELQYMDRQLSYINNTATQRLSGIMSTIIIPVKINLIGSFDGNIEAGLTDAVLMSDIAELNNTLYAGSDIQFELCGISRISYVNFSIPALMDNVIENNEGKNMLNVYFSESNKYSDSWGIYPPGPNRAFILYGHTTTAGDYAPILAHEIGHVLGLIHTFGEETKLLSKELVIRTYTPGKELSQPNCGTSADRLCDTQADPGYYDSGCANCFYPMGIGCINTNTDFINGTCGMLGTVIDLNNDCYYTNLTQDNIMNYNSNNCRLFFTQGQKSRMYAFASLLTNLVAPCSTLVAEFKADQSWGCPPLTVGFTDESRGIITSWLWNFGDGTTSTLQNPFHTFTTSGNFTVTLTVNDGIQPPMTKTKSDFVKVNNVVFTLPYKEDFETGTFSSMNWRVENTNNDVVTWELITQEQEDDLYLCPGDEVTIIGADGAPTTAARILMSYNGSVDALISPAFDLSETTNDKLFFDLAYRQLQTYGSVADVLQVYYSNDCGATWVSLFNKSACDLATVTPCIQACKMVPQSGCQWRNEEIDISMIDDASVRFKFEFTSGENNSLLIDNVSINELITYSNGYIPANNENWDDGKMRRVTGDIIVHNGVTFTIRNGTRVEFAENSGIIVEKGGKLIIDGATLAALSECSDVRWDGIQVKGDMFSPQSDNPLTDPNLRQGYVLVKNGSRIENALKAINVSVLGWGGRGGGIVHVTNDPGNNLTNVFANNNIDIFFSPYPHDNKSSFQNVKFETTQPLRNDNIPPNYRFTSMRIYMGMVQGVDFGSDVIFRNTDIPNFFSGASSTIVNPNDPGSHAMVFENCALTSGEVFSNQMRDTDYGIQTQGDNRQLRIRCNNFSYQGFTHKNSWYTVKLRDKNGNIAGNNSLKNQGTSGCVGDASLTAGNRWEDLCTTSGEVSDIFTEVDFDYFANPIDAVTNKSTPYPDCSTPTWKADHLNPGVICLDASSNSCDIPIKGIVPPPPDKGCYDAFNQWVLDIRKLINVHRVEAKAFSDLLKEVILRTDGGNTAELIRQIKRIPPLSALALRDRLFTSLPLSETALRAVIYRRPALPPGLLMEVLIANSPIPEKLMEELIAMNPSLPPSVLKEIEAAQNQEPRFPRQKDLRDKIEFQKGEALLLENLLLREMPPCAKDNAIEMLRESPFPESRKTLAGILLDERDFSGTRNELNNVTLLTASEEILKDSINATGDRIENENFCKFMNCMLGIAESGRTIQEINTSELQTLREVANSKMVVSANAEIIITEVTSEKYEHPIIKTNSLSRNNARNGTNSANENSAENLLGDNDFIRIIPNPLTNKAYIESFITNEAKTELNIFDLLGKHVKRISLQHGYNYSSFNVDELNSGIYLYRLNTNQDIKNHGKLIISK